MVRIILIIQFILALPLYADWHGGYVLKSSFKNAKQAIDDVLDTPFPNIANSTYQLLKVIRLRLSKHPDYVNRIDSFGWMRHDIILFRQLKKNFRSQSKFYGQDQISRSVDEIESRYKEIMKLGNLNVKDI